MVLLLINPLHCEQSQYVVQTVFKVVEKIKCAISFYNGSAVVAYNVESMDRKVSLLSFNE